MRRQGLLDNYTDEELDDVQKFLDPRYTTPEEATLNAFRDNSVQSICYVTNKYFGTEENLEQDYFAEKVNFVPDASNYYTQICLDNGHKENLVDIPEIIRNDSANIYRVQSNELAILKKYKKDSNKYSNKIDTYYTRLKASKNIKQTMDLLAEMQIDKQKFDYITKLTDSYLKKEQTRKVRYKTRIENIRRNFYFEVDANQLKQSFHSY